LHARIQEQERIAYVEALNTVFSGQMRWSGRRALLGHGDVAAGTGARNQSQE
jgi:folate-dependent phosphoribosylglycinamide formyltransferase PurN